MILYIYNVLIFYLNLIIFLTFSCIFIRYKYVDYLITKLNKKLQLCIFRLQDIIIIVYTS